MRVMTILGTRPEIIRLSRVIALLDEHIDHVLVHTGQNFDDRLSRIFFEELKVREPNVHMGIRAASFSEQIGKILTQAEQLFLQHKPDRLLILGDTNSGLSALVARRLGIPVYHMEAGNRCYDDRVPEEVNRRVIDHSSSVLLPYTQNSKENLLREGIANHRIYVTGNPIFEVMTHYQQEIAQSDVLERLELEGQKYFVVTLHRAENVDIARRLHDVLTALRTLYRRYGFPVICSVHPRTKSRMKAFGFDTQEEGLRFLEPFGFFDFIRLEKEAFCLLSDSGTVQEEACLWGVPNVTIRDVTERPETLECGSNLLSGAHPEAIVRAVEQVTRRGNRTTPPAPIEYQKQNVADTVCRIVTSYRLPDAAELAWMEGSR